MKKTLCVMLAVLLLISSFPIYASENSLPNSLEDALSTIMMGMKSHPEDYGLEDVDFTKISVGNAIHGYLYNDNGSLSPVEDEYYPIFYNNEVIVLALGHYDDGELVGMQASVVGVDVLNTFLNSNDEAAIISFNDVPYFVSPDGDIAAFYASEKEPLIQMPDDANIAYTSIQASQTVALVLPSYPAPAYDQPVKVSFPTYKQALSNSCWAAVTRGFLYKYTGKVYTEAQIYNAAGLPYVSSQGGNLGSAADAVHELGYNVTFSMKTPFSFSNIQYYINAGEPLFMGLVNAANGGHAVALTGYTVYSQSPSYAGTIFIMDPWVGQIQEVLVTKSNTFTYTLSGYAPLSFLYYSQFYIYTL